MAVQFKLELEANPRTGTQQLAVVKYADGADREVWCTIDDLDQLFDAAQRKWGQNWDLKKVLTAIDEANFV